MAKPMVKRKRVPLKELTYFLLRNLVVFSIEHLSLQLLKGKLESFEAMFKRTSNQIKISQLILW